MKDTHPTHPEAAAPAAGWRRWTGFLLKYAVPVIISVGLCYLLFTGIDFREMLEIIRTECDFRWIAFALALSVFSHIFRALRWQIQLTALDVNPPLYAIIYSIFGTYAVNLVFPRLGEVWRTGYISQRQDAPFVTVFGSMVADRLADTLTVLLITLGTLCFAAGAIMDFVRTNGESYARIIDLLESPWLWGAVALLIAGAWWLLTRRGATGIIAKIQKAARELWQGFAVVLKMPGRGRWLLWTVALWGCYFAQLYVAFFAFPFTRQVLADHGIIAALVAYVLGSISMAVPSNGGIGPWQWAVIFALGIYGLDAARAGAFANIVLGTQTIMLIVLGIITFTGIAADRRKSRRRQTQHN